MNMVDPVSPGWVTSDEDGVITLRSVLDGSAIASGESIASLSGTERALIEPIRGQWQLVEARSGMLVKNLGAFVKRVEWSGPGTAFGLRDDQDRCTIWQAASGNELAQAQRCGALAVSPDGSVVAFWTDKGVELFEIPSGQHLTTLEGSVKRLAFSPGQGAPTLVAGWDDRAQLLRTRDGTVIEAFPGPLEVSLSEAGNTSSVTYSADGRLVFVRLDSAGDPSGAPPADGLRSLQIAATGDELVPVAPDDPASDPGLPVDVEFSPDPSSQLVRITFSNNTIGLYRTSDLTRIDTSGDPMTVRFTSAPLGFA